jgi:hypothetical protein
LEVALAPLTRSSGVGEALPLPPAASPLSLGSGFPGGFRETEEGFLMLPQPAPDPQIEFINSGEEALLRARVISRQIQERVWKAMAGNGLVGPHAPEPFVEQERNTGTESERTTGESPPSPI